MKSYIRIEKKGKTHDSPKIRGKNIRRNCKRLSHDHRTTVFLDWTRGHAREYEEKITRDLISCAGSYRPIDTCRFFGRTVTGEKGVDLDSGEEIHKMILKWDKLHDSRPFTRIEFNLAYLLLIIGARPFQPSLVRPSTVSPPFFFHLSNDDPWLRIGFRPSARW